MPPIKPDDVSLKQAEQIPDDVFKAFNELIAANWNGYEAVVTVSEAAKLARAKLGAAGGWKQHWLNVEDAYRASGWHVTYSSPDWGESGDGYYRFKRK